MLLALMLAANTLFGQSRISVKAADTLDFILFLNDVQVNNMACLSITLDNIEPGKMMLKVNFPTRPQFNFSQSVTIKKATFVYYEIEKSKGSMKLLLKSESTVATTDTQMSAETIEAPLEAETEIPVISDSTNLVIHENQNCVKPVDASLYDSLLKDIDKNFFETRKLEVIKAFMVEHCVRVEQLRYLMSRLSLEDSKLDLLKSSLHHVVDRNNLKKVEQDFFLEKNKARAAAIIEAGMLH